MLCKYLNSIFKETFSPIGRDELIEFCIKREGAFIGLDQFEDYVLSQLPDLKVIGICSAGANHIDPAAMKKYSKRMCWVAGINKIAVPEMTISHTVNIPPNFHNFSREAPAGN